MHFYKICMDNLKKNPMYITENSDVLKINRADVQCPMGILQGHGNGHCPLLEFGAL